MSTRKSFILIIVAALFIFVTGGYAYVQAAAVSSEKEYIISSGDILEISVYGEADLSTTVRVSQSGTINYTILGTIKAAGFSVRELEKNIQSLLGEDYLVIPQVSIFVKEYAKISLLGALKRPGSYELKQNLTLTEAIAIAGGFTESADDTNVKIIRTAGGKKETFEINVARILKKAAQDIELKAGDVIMVEEYGKVSILGQVRGPGTQQLKENLTLTEAIALAGGFTESADDTNIKLIRTSGGKKETFEINVDRILKKAAQDIELTAGDIITVEEYGRFSIMGQVMRPGVYNLKKDLTVVEAIGLAGGFTTTAAQNGVKVIRERQGQRQIIRVPVANIMKNADQSRDILLEEGDTVVVSESFF